MRANIYMYMYSTAGLLIRSSFYYDYGGVDTP